MKLDTVPLSSLKVDPANVRQIGAGADPELKASIAALGILVPLVVRPNGDGYMVIDGGRRLAAAQALLKEGHFSADDPVPVVEQGKIADAEARESSLAVNVHRRALHPVDEFRSFAALHKDKTRPLDVEAIAKRFGLHTRHVEQRLALGQLHDDVLQAWVDGTIGADAARAFTLTDKKGQAAVLAKLSKRSGDREIGAWEIKSALKIGHNNPGRLLNAVGQAAYEKRGGKVTRDLFGDDHIISDPKLLQAMTVELIAAECERLVQDGWSWAMPKDDVQDSYKYGAIEAKGKPTPAQAKRLAELTAEAESAETPLLQREAAAAEHANIEEAIEAAAYSPEQKARSGVFVGIDHHGRLSLEYGLVKPKDKPKAETGDKGAPAKKAAPRKGDDHVSNALVQRLSTQLTNAAGVAIVKQPAVAMAALLAGFASGERACAVSERGLVSKRNQPAARSSSFASVLETMLGRTAADLQKALCAIAGQALDFECFNSDSPPLKDKNVLALCSAIDAKALNAALRDAFDATDYFDAVAKSVIVGAVKEAMGDDHAAKLAKLPKGDAAKFAIANLPKTGWLPPQLRIPGYDGPTAKAKAAKPKATAKRVGKTKRRAA